jgi:hypothetical protein
VFDGAAACTAALEIPSRPTTIMEEIAIRFISNNLSEVISERYHNLFGFTRPLVNAKRPDSHKRIWP